MAPAGGNTQGQTNLLHAMMLSQAQMAAKKAQEEAKKVSQEHQKLTKEHQKVQKESEKHKKQKETLEKEHKDAKKELHSYKMQFDAKYAFDYKQEQKGRMQRVRDAKGKKQKGVRELSKQKRNGKSS